MLEIFNYLGEIFNGLTERKGLKILTPNQMLSRLPITLTQLKAGNNPEKLKNEIRQLLCSLIKKLLILLCFYYYNCYYNYYVYRSKKLTEQLYKSFIDIIQKWKQSL